MGFTVTRPVQDPLAVKLLDNRLLMIKVKLKLKLTNLRQIDIKLLKLDGIENFTTTMAIKN